MGRWWSRGGRYEDEEEEEETIRLMKRTMFMEGGTDGGRVVAHTQSDEEEPVLSLHHLLGDCIINAHDVIRDSCGGVWGGSESGISKFTHRLSLRERPAKSQKSAQDCPPNYRRRSLSVDWADSTKMSQPVRGESGRKASSLSSPSAARRLYRNLSGKFRVGSAPSGLEDGPPAAARAGEKERPRKSNMFQCNEALFEAVEHQEPDLVQLLLSQYSLEELDLNTPNSEGLLPLDIAIMTNNVPMARLLLRAGAKESPHFVSLEGRTLHLSTLLQEADQRVSELQAQLGGEGPGEREGSERQLKAWGWRQRLFRRMKTGFEHACPPDHPVGVSLSVSGSSSLRVDFQEPSSVNAAVVTKYKVGWSTSPSMSPLLGETLVEDTTQLRCDITGLKTGSYYYIQVTAYNMKGWGPSCNSIPGCAAPSSWRETDGRAPRQRGHKEALDQLLSQMKEAHSHCSCH
ncbi:hypothetical protein NHX12_024874, partial [Muraenolepis orangiensis]